MKSKEMAEIHIEYKGPISALGGRIAHVIIYTDGKAKVQWEK